VFHLARVFKARTGFSLHAYRTQLRLRAALERVAPRHGAGPALRLRSGQAPRRGSGHGGRDVDLIDIALDLGFSSHSHFTEAFRRNFGTTPSAVRNRPF
jgi:AraC family transcriptional regulator